MDEKIKEILDKPEVPDFLCPENIPALIKENGRKRKIKVIKPLRTIAAAAACLALITVGLKVFTDTNTKNITNSADSFTAVQKTEDCMCDDKAEEDMPGQDSLDSDTELINPESYDFFSQLLIKSDPGDTEKGAENKIDPAKSSQPEMSEQDINSAVSVKIMKEGKILISNDQTDKYYTFEELFTGFSKKDIEIKEYVVLENNIYIIADLIHDSDSFTGVQKLDTETLDHNNDIFCIQSGKYKNKFLSHSNRLILISDQNVRENNTEDIVPVYGSSIDELYGADNKSVYCSSSLAGNSYESLDILSISAIDDLSQKVSDHKVYVCPSPVLNLGKGDNTESVIIKSGIIEDTVLYNCETGDLVIDNKK